MIRAGKPVSNRPSANLAIILIRLAFEMFEFLQNEFKNRKKLWGLIVSLISLSIWVAS